ncbi:transcriptional regulator domain-containing protein [Roseomonas mucosa]
MLSIDWRSPAAYAHAKTISAAGFAWEYLRRNDEYRADFLSVSADGLVGADRLERFVRRWGLRFPKRSRRTA